MSKFPISNVEAGTRKLCRNIGYKFSSSSKISGDRRSNEILEEHAKHAEKIGDPVIFSNKFLFEKINQWNPEDT
jgi:hypothetical protein